VSQSIDNLSSHSMLVAMLSQQRVWSPWSKLFKRELFTQNDVHWPAGINMAEDLLVIVKLFVWAKRVNYLNKALYYYNRDNVNSLVNTISINACQQSQSAIHQTLEFLENKGLIPELNPSLMSIKLMLRFNMLYTLDNTLLEKLVDVYPETNQFVWTYDMAGFHWRLLMYCRVNGHYILFRVILFFIELSRKAKK
jgi:hypothetical protein